MPAVRDLESCEPSAWKESLIMAELGQRDAIQLVACRNDLLIGWCCVRFVDAEAELLKIGVQAESRRQKISSRLLASIENRLYESGARELFLEVRSCNCAAISFYRSVGFTEVARRIRYYTLPVDDALLFKKGLVIEKHLPWEQR